MDEDQLMEEMLIKKLEAQQEAQEADMEAKGLMDAPDSFQIAGIEEDELCNECDSANTYISVATPYNTVRVCKDCGHEEHTPTDIKFPWPWPYLSTHASRGEDK